MEIRSYRDLRVWQEGMSIAESCYRLTQVFPKSELFGMTSQIRRAAASVPANIAEGHGRETTGEFVQFLRVAQGSLKELETHLMLATRVGLLAQEKGDALLVKTDELGRMLHSLIRTLQKKRA